LEGSGEAKKKGSNLTWEPELSLPLFGRNNFPSIPAQTRERKEPLKLLTNFLLKEEGLGQEIKKLG